LETLVSLDDSGKAKPKLALSWSSSDDFKVWTFKLRPDVKFHDGTPFNARPCVEHRPPEGSENNCRCAFYVANILSVEPKDDLTVVYTLKDPAVNFRSAGAARPERDRPFADGDPGQGRRLQPQSGRHRPFVVKSWTAGDRMVVERNPIIGTKASRPRPRGAAAAA